MNTLRTVKTRLIRHSILSVCLCGASATAATTRYVDFNSPAPTAPYTNWVTAAHTIQDAVDLANPDDQVLVNDGVYQAGWRVSNDGVTNRLLVTKAVSLQSVNGAAMTLINGGGTMRCVYLSSAATLAGFTLTNGTAANGGGLYSTSTNPVLSNCVLINNLAVSGGGAYSGTLNNCTLSGNRCPGTGGNGGGANLSVLNNCTLSSNLTGTPYPGSSGSSWGGGAATCMLSNCTLSGNSSYGAGAHGGGALNSTLNRCTLSGNFADHNGGAAHDCAMTNCIVFNNGAGYGGGGVSGGTVINTVITGNHAGFGGGVYWTTTLRNCIIYYNWGGDNYGDTLEYCCTPDANGVGCIASEPLFVNRYGGDFHLQAASPCIDRGINPWVTTLTDWDGNLRIANGTVDIGPYEFQRPNPLAVTIRANNTNVVVNFPVDFAGLFSRGTSDVWDFADGTIISNQVFVSHTWASPGDYPVTLSVFDSSNPAGVSAMRLIHVIPPPLSYVDPSSTNPVPPFSSWGTAATNIHDAVDAAVFGTHILVTNSIWDTGGRLVYGSLTNRLVISKPVTVQSVNGPAVTVIQGNPVLGDAAVRCVYLTNGAALSGFTLLNGATRTAGDSYKEQSGGGAWCESTNAVVSNCLFISNRANVYGGGIRGGTLSNCSLLANSATGSGGGAYSSHMSGCLLSNNTAILTYGGISGGGASSCTLVSCTLLSNVTDTPWSAPAWGGGAVDSTLIDCSLIGNSGKDGGGAHNSSLRNCRLLANTAGNAGGAASVSTLIGCSLIGNSAALGGGCYDSVGTNCVLQQNTSIYQGGGACGSLLCNSLITGNAAPGSVGGGTAGDPSGVGSTLINCTVLSNSAYYRGGGVANSTAWNSIILSNAANDSANWYAASLEYCCTAPLPEPGLANFTNAPMFTPGSYQLHPNSPCINAGTNSYVAPGLDLAKNPRLIGGTVDVGAYECQSPALLDCYGWLQSYGLSTYAPSVYADADSDGLNNFQEWIAGTIPTNAASALRMLSTTDTPLGIDVTWSSVTNRSYSLERATDLSAMPAFAAVRSNLSGLPDVTACTDTNFTGAGPFFYRVRVER